MSEPLAYFITFTTYGAWLHGRKPGSVDRDHNAPGTPFLPADPEQEAACHWNVCGRHSRQATASICFKRSVKSSSSRLRRLRSKRRSVMKTADMTAAINGIPKPSASVGLRASSKIGEEHGKKLAIVYVRQSSPQQVVENQESRARQYALADLAKALGWPASACCSSTRIKGKAARVPTIVPAFNAC
jgi:hypothetical protein